VGHVRHKKSVFLIRFQKYELTLMTFFCGVFIPKNDTEQQIPHFKIPKLKKMTHPNAQG
jgi:hypothetical protein